DRVVGPGDVARPGNAHAAAVRQATELLLPPAGPLDGLQALEEAVGLDPQLVDRAGVRAEEVAAPELDRVEADGLGELVELDLEGEARLHGPVSALRPARGFIGVNPRGVEAITPENVRR